MSMPEARQAGHAPCLTPLAYRQGVRYCFEVNRALSLLHDSPTRGHSAVIGLESQSCSIGYHHMSRSTNGNTVHTTLNQSADKVSRLRATTTHKCSQYGSLYKVEAATYLHRTFVLVLIINNPKHGLVKQ